MKKSEKIFGAMKHLDERVSPSLCPSICLWVQPAYSLRTEGPIYKSVSKHLVTRIGHPIDILFSSHLGILVEGLLSFSAKIVLLLKSLLEVWSLVSAK